MYDSDYAFLQHFNRGYCLPYSTYDPSYAETVLQYKRNNAAALVICLDGLREYVDSDIKTQKETVAMLFDEMASFCVNGVFGIGFYGVSVENGMPMRVDSCGINISKQYRSVYAKMTAEQYASLDRIESMTLDQREERKFRRHILKYKYALEDTLHSVLEERDAENASPVIARCMKLDRMFLAVCSEIGRMDAASAQLPINIWNVPRQISEVERLMEPYRELLEDDDTLLIGDYTMTDMKPVTPTQVMDYRMQSTTGKVPVTAPDENEGDSTQ